VKFALEQRAQGLMVSVAHVCEGKEYGLKSLAGATSAISAGAVRLSPLIGRTSWSNKVTC